MICFLLTHDSLSIPHIRCHLRHSYPLQVSCITSGIPQELACRLCLRPNSTYIWTHEHYWRWCQHCSAGTQGSQSKSRSLFSDALLDCLCAFAVSIVELIMCSSKLIFPVLSKCSSFISVSADITRFSTVSLRPVRITLLVAPLATLSTSFHQSRPVFSLSSSSVRLQYIANSMVKCSGLCAVSQDARHPRRPDCMALILKIGIVSETGTRQE